MSNWIKVGNRAIDLDKIEEVAIWKTGGKRGNLLPCVNILFTGNQVLPNGDIVGGLTQLVEPEASEFLAKFAEATDIELKLEVPA